MVGFLKYSPISHFGMTALRESPELKVCRNKGGSLVLGENVGGLCQRKHFKSSHPSFPDIHLEEIAWAIWVQVEAGLSN